MNDFNELDVNNALWGIFTNVTLQAVDHLGRDYMENLRCTKNQLFKSVKQTVVPSDWKVEKGSDRNEWSDHNWPRTDFVEINESTVWQSRWDYECRKLRLPYLIWEVSVTNQSKPGKTTFNDIWKHVIKKILNRIDGEQVEFEWNFSQDSLHLDFSRFNSWWLNYSVNLSNSKVGSSSRHRTRTLYGENKETHKNKIMLADLLERWSLVDPGSEKKWYATCSHESDGDMDKFA